MKCKKEVVYSEFKRFGYETFISVAVRRYDRAEHNDVVVEQHVVEDDADLLHTREVLNGDAYSNAELQRKGIRMFDELRTEFSERFTRKPEEAPLEF